MSANNGGPAFPENIHIFDPRSSGVQSFSGMSLRDYFAAKALQGMWANHAVLTSGQIQASECPATQLAINAYELADAMLAARKAGA